MFLKVVGVGGGVILFLLCLKFFNIVGFLLEKFLVIIIYILLKIVLVICRVVIFIFVV